MRPTLRFLRSVATCAATLAAAILLAAPSFACDDHPSPLESDLLSLTGTDSTLVETDHPGAPCTGGFADIFPCSNVDLMHWLDTSELGGGSGNDLWGWTDPATDREYALMGISSGIVFVDVTDPATPVILGTLPTHTSNSSWRDVKVYADHAFIVSEAGGHGMQVFDLTELRSVPAPPATFTETAHYPGFGSAHNIVINEDTGYAYAVGSTQCSGGLEMIDISAPTSPTLAGCFSSDGYTHDAQCVVYNGPDVAYQGQEICFGSNTDTLTIVDVTDKANPVQLSRTGYAGVGYTHQGWLTDDHTRFLLNDEVDELNAGHNTRTYIWDVTDLDLPTVQNIYVGPTTASDHNLYVHNGYAYEANYRAGLRILSLADVANGNLTEVAYFDTEPASNNVGTAGAWSVYPYFASGTVIVSSIQSGLFILKPILCSEPAAPTGLSAVAGGDQQIDLTWSAGLPGETFNVLRSFGTCPGGAFQQVASGVAGNSYSDTTVSGQVDYSYLVSTSDGTGLCVSAPSGCSSASTTGACTAEPVFAGVDQVTNQATPGCALEVSWNAASPNCGPGVTYSVYRSEVAGFVPSPADRVATGLAGTTWTDTGVTSGTEYFYVVRATDTGNGSEDGNAVEVGGTATGPIADGDWETGAEIGDRTLLFDTPSSGGTTDRHLGWELETARAHSGARSFFSSYENSVCLAIVTPPIDLTAGQPAELSFWSVFDIEPRWDGGVVEISTDGGASWSLLTLDQGYPETFRSSSDACGYAEGHPSFSGTDLTWGEYTADLSAHAGAQIQLRWIFSTDGGLTEEGWYVDDISVAHAQIPGPCSSVGIFSDGFESGDTTAWSGVAP